MLNTLKTKEILALLINKTYAKHYLIQKMNQVKRLILMNQY